MNNSSHSPGTIVALRQYCWVCLVLVAVLLYNPFFATPRSGNGLEVCHPASHRATVGVADTNAACEYRLTEMVLAFTIAAPK